MWRKLIPLARRGLVCEANARFTIGRFGPSVESGQKGDQNSYRITSCAEFSRLTIFLCKLRTGIFLPERFSDFKESQKRKSDMVMGRGVG